MNPVYFYPEAKHQLKSYLSTQIPSKIFILTDENTQEHCLSKLLQSLETKILIEIIEIESGEEHKVLETCTGIWNVLTELGADRKSLFFNLGGGVITDLGGFVASTFKRGINFIHIPTSLLAMVDAAIGGKTGIDLGSLKNQIGLFSSPKMVLIDPKYLETLPQNQLKCGLAEMWKHGLIYRKSYWEKLKDLAQLTFEDFPLLIEESINIKTEIVEKDPEEESLRKILNFGHTLGHAIESHFLCSENKPTLLHGEAIAAGMVLESFLSSEICGFPKKQLEEIKNTIFHTFPKIDLKEADFEPIINLLKHDKKNSSGKVNFTLLKSIGKPITDCHVERELILKALTTY